MNLADELLTFLRCPGCSNQDWDLRAEGMDDLPRLEGTLCCGNCGMAFAARGGVLDMVPDVVEGRWSTFRRRLISPPVVRLYEEHLRHFMTPLASPLRDIDRVAWLKRHAPTRQARYVIDLGCARGKELEVMRNETEAELALGVDLSRVMLAEASRAARLAGHKNVAFIRANLEELVLEGGRFDWTSCYGVLHRLEHPTAALQKFASLLRPDGIATLLTTRHLDEGTLGIGQKIVGEIGRIHLFQNSELKSMLSSASLELLNIEAYGPVTLVSARRLANEGP